MLGSSTPCASVHQRQVPYEPQLCDAFDIRQRQPSIEGKLMDWNLGGFRMTKGH